MSPPPEYTHDNVVTRFNRLLILGLERIGDHGKVYAPRAAIWTGANTYLEPDLFYLSRETEMKLDPRRRITADLIIEVVSPASAIYDRNTKADTDAALGVKELWLADELSKEIEVRTLEGDRYTPGTLLAWPRLQHDVVSQRRDIDFNHLAGNQDRR